MSDDEGVREQVRNHYAGAALTAASGSACGCESSGCCGEGVTFGPGLYDAANREGLPEAALLASLGCGNPTAVAELLPGEKVLDLGSGGGIDALLSAQRVGPAGRVYGLDMTDEMLRLARENKEKAGADNVEFLKGYIEEIPLPAAAVDVVISNCVINLSAHKERVFGEMFRVLKPGGRLGISDVVSSNDLTPEQRAERGSFVGCVAGALSFQEYERGLRRAGFTEIEVTPTHEAADGIFAAIVKARRD